MYATFWSASRTKLELRLYLLVFASYFYQRAAPAFRSDAADHNKFGSNRSKIMDATDSDRLEGAGRKSSSCFASRSHLRRHPAPFVLPQCFPPQNPLQGDQGDSIASKGLAIPEAARAPDPMERTLCTSLIPSGRALA
jgi:hypothetical protein